MPRRPRLLQVVCALVVAAGSSASAESVAAANGLVVQLGSTTVGAPVTTEITLTNPSVDREMPFGFDGADDGFEIGPVPALLAPGERIEVPITLLAEAPGEYELVIRIYRDLGEESAEDGMITFQVFGTVTP